ncbi:MAG: hypothetical protein ACW98X_23390, partial [Promethearchaeota archaeon]
VLFNIDFDQMVWEFGDDKEPNWVHISYRKDGKNRKKVTIARKVLKAGGYVAEYETITKK